MSPVRFVLVLIKLIVMAPWNSSEATDEGQTYLLLFAHSPTLMHLRVESFIVSLTVYVIISSTRAVSLAIIITQIKKIIITSSATHSKPLPRRVAGCCHLMNLMA